MSRPGDSARRLHDEAAGMDPRANRSWPGGPVGDAAWAGVVALDALNGELAFQGTSLLLMDRRDLAAMIERTAKAAQLEGFSSTFERLVALALAGVVSAHRAEELDVSAGDAT